MRVEPGAAEPIGGGAEGGVEAGGADAPRPVAAAAEPGHGQRDVAMAGRLAALVPRVARPGDLPEIQGLLEQAGLPTAGVADWLPRFVVVDDSGRVVAAAGMELYGRAALLRSVVVSPELRGSGLGAALTDRIAADATAAGARMLYLLTTTADAYFPRLGFQRIRRDELPSDLSVSEELKGACPATAVVMARPI